MLARSWYWRPRWSRSRVRWERRFQARLSFGGKVLRAVPGELEDKILGPGCQVVKTSAWQSRGREFEPGSAPGNPPQPAVVSGMLLVLP